MGRRIEVLVSEVVAAAFLLYLVHHQEMGLFRQFILAVAVVTWTVNAAAATVRKS